MSDQRIRDLLHEVAEGIEPGDRLDAIRSATAPAGRRTGWWAAGGVSLVAASVVTALALSTGGTPRSQDPDPAEPTPTTVETSTPPALENLDVWVYYAGETPDGQRLYRELRSRAATDPLDAAVDALSMAPADPDYVSLWPAAAIYGATFDGIGDDGQISVEVDRTYALRPDALTVAQAELAVEQVVRTLQAATRSTAGVRFYADGSPIKQVLGVPTTEPLRAGSDLAVLAHVSISDPSEGTEVDNDEPFTVAGLGNSFEGNIVTWIQRWEGTDVVDEEPAIAGTYEDRLFPFEVTFDLTDVPPGDYVVSSRTDDPSGEGRFHTDSRRITIVD